MDLYIKPVTGSEEAHLVLASANRKELSDWSPDGRFLVFAQESASKQFGLYALPLESEPKPLVLVEFRVRRDPGRRFT
jgi:dipeptidyl aminopeptidase/acylaminoacyl peptidase